MIMFDSRKKQIFFSKNKGRRIYKKRKNTNSFQTQAKSIVMNFGKQ